MLIYSEHIIYRMSDKLTQRKNKLYSIWLSKENRERLAMMGHAGESYNTVVTRILEQIKENR